MFTPLDPPLFPPRKFCFSLIDGLDQRDPQTPAEIRAEQIGALPSCRSAWDPIQKIMADAEFGEALLRHEIKKSQQNGG